MEGFSMLDMISDGKLYTADDMALADSLGCEGCSFCCENMCDTIVLDPYDIYLMSKGTGKDYNALIDEGYLETSLHNLLVLPHIKNTGKGCGFLTDQKRCSIHESRPGNCRLFPLGRYYHDGSFSYILQRDQCRAENKGPIRVRDWLEIPELEKYEKYALNWHYFIKELSSFIMESKDRAAKMQVSDMLLSRFYKEPYDTKADFYDQFNSRFEQAKKNMPV